MKLSQSVTFINILQAAKVFYAAFLYLNFVLACIFFFKRKLGKAASKMVVNFTQWQPNAISINLSKRLSEKSQYMSYMRHIVKPKSQQNILKTDWKKEQMPWPEFTLMLSR